MRTKAEATLVRRNLTLHARTANRLDRLRTRTEAGSDSEVVKTALRYYELFAEDGAQGKRLFVSAGSPEKKAITLDSERDPEAGELVRRNLMLHERSAERLDTLRELTNATSNSEVVRQALRLYEILIDNIFQDHTFSQDNGDGTGATPVRMRELESFRPARPRRNEQPAAEQPALT